VNRIKSAKVGSVVLVMGLIMAASAVFQIATYRNATRMEEIAARDAHVRDVLASVAALRSALQDTVIGQSGYLLTGQSQELQMYRSAAASVPELLERVRSLASDDAEQAASAKVLMPAIQKKLENLRQGLPLPGHHVGEAATGTPDDAGTDAQLTRQIRQVLDQMTAREQQLRAQCLAETKAAASGQSALLVSASVYRVFVLVAGCVLILRQQARQRRTERHCRQSEELFRNAFDHTTTGMALSDHTGRWVKVNRALCEMVGYGEQELLRLGIRSVSDPQHPDPEGAPAQQRERRFIHRDGRTVWALVTSSMVRSEDGRPQTYISHIQDITEQRRAEERLRHLSLHDALTGLPNRRLLIERIQRGIERAKQEPGYRLAVLFLDLDQFKLINDSLGHAAGDRLLVAVAECLSRCVRAGDSVVAGGSGGDGHTVARLAGDEFTVVLEGLRAPTDAQTVAGRILRELERPVDFGGRQIRAAASIGIVYGDARQYSSARELLADADTALYKAKAAGRGQFAVFDPDMPPTAPARPSLAEERLNPAFALAD
jgi:diguanylate cyclase (GGDEF)-like protein/PAS domain S-box-containing protein